MVVVSRALGELERAGLITKAPMAQAREGRPTYAYSVAAGAFFSVGINVFPNHLTAVVVDSDKQIRSESHIAITWSGDPSATAEELREAVHAVVSEVVGTTAQSETPAAIGICVPGIVDPDNGVWIRGFHVPGVSRLDVAAALKPIGGPLQIEDYTRALAFHEMTTGNGRANTNLAVVNLGLGVGSAVIVDRSIYRGTHGLAGEIGHISVDPNGRRCTCGMIGCVETVCSVPGILESVRHLREAGVVSGVAPGEAEWTVATLVDLLRKGDRLVSTVVAEAAEALTAALATLIKVTNPERIVITGPGAALFEPVRDTLHTNLRLRILPEMEQDLDIVFADYQPNHEARGVALLAVDRHWPRLERK